MNTSHQTCCVCLEIKSKQLRACDLCNELTCKKCLHFLEPTTFDYLPKIPPKLTLSYYCTHCQHTEVLPELEKYNEIKLKAENTYIFYIEQKRQIPLIKRGHRQIVIENCADRDETIERLAFLATLQEFNAVIGVKLESKKTDNNGYKHSVWSGVGYPAHVNDKQMERLI